MFKKSQEIKIMHVNCQSNRRAVEVLDLFAASGTYDVLCLQEAKMLDADLATFRQYAVLLGYSVYSTQGPQSKGRWGQILATGGVVTLVKTSLRQIQHRSIAKNGAQLISVQVERWKIVNVYITPTRSDKTDLGSMITELFEVDKDMGKRWLLLVTGMTSQSNHRQHKRR